MEYLYIIIICVAMLVVIAAFLYCQNNIIDITQYEIDSRAVSKKYRIVHLSDFHSKSSAEILNKVNALSPDIICITGDFINDKCDNRKKMLRLAGRLSGCAPVYYIPGNHECRLDCFDSLMQELRDAGFTVLLNDSARHEDIAFLGLMENQADFSDYKARRNGTFEYKDMSPYLTEFEKQEGYRIALSHFPENFEAIEQMDYSKYDIDLQLSGHAHGGQFILPLIGPVFSPGQGIMPKYARGCFGKRPMLIVSRGLGNAEFPFRLFNHPEIIAIDINNPND